MLAAPPVLVRALSVRGSEARGRLDADARGFERFPVEIIRLETNATPGRCRAEALPHTPLNVVSYWRPAKGGLMPRVVRCGLIQARAQVDPDAPLADIKRTMVARHVELVAEAARQRAQAVCLQELFYGPYFCAEQETRWYQLTERVP